MVENGVSGAPRWTGGVVVERAAGEAKEKERAESGDAPMRDGLEVGTTERGPTDDGVVVDRYHGLRVLSCDTVTENRDEAEPTPMPFVPVASRAAAGSNRSDAVRGYAVNDASSSESSKSSEHERPHSLPEDGEEGRRVDDEGAVEAAGVVVGDDLERAHEQVEESRRRPEKACIEEEDELVDEAGHA